MMLVIWTPQSKGCLAACIRAVELAGGGSSSLFSTQVCVLVSVVVCLFNQIDEVGTMSRQRCVSISLVKQPRRGSVINRELKVEITDW